MNRVRPRVQVSSDDASCVRFKSLGGEWEDKLLFKWLRPRTFHRLRLRLTDAALPDGIGCDSPSEASRSILVFNLHAMLGCDGEATSVRNLAPTTPQPPGCREPHAV